MRIKIGILCCLFFISLLQIGCEPATTIEIKNDTSQTFDIWLFIANPEHVLMNTGESLGISKPSSILKQGNIVATLPVYLFEARDLSGNVVYSQYYTKEELAKAGWKIAISAGNESGNSPGFQLQ